MAFSPEGEVDAGLVPDDDHLAPLRFAASQRVEIAPLDGAHVVLALAAVPPFAGRQVGEVVRAQAEGEKVAGRPLLCFVARAHRRVVASGGLVVAVAGAHRETVEFGDRRERVVAARRHLRGERRGERTQVLQPPLALERLEKQVDGDALAAGVAVELDEVAPRGRGGHAPQHAHLEEVEVGELRAVVAPRRAGVAPGDGREEA